MPLKTAAPSMNRLDRAEHGSREKGAGGARAPVGSSVFEMQIGADDLEQTRRHTALRDEIPPRHP